MKRVLISGAGVAGIVCATLLDKNKFDVTLVEKSDEFRNIGYSVVLWKSCYELLFKLCKKNGVSLVSQKDYFLIDNFVILRGNNLKVFNKIYSESMGVVFEREHLMKKLQEVLSKNFDLKKIHFSKTIKEIRGKEVSYLVTFDDGSSKKYDLVIIAEGINSTSRKIIFPKEKIRQYPYTLKYAWFGSSTNLGNNITVFLTKGSGGVIHPPSSKNLLGYYIRNDATPKFQKALESSIRNTIKQTNGNNSAINLLTSRMFKLKEVLLNEYHKGTVVLVGDAAHGRPPSTGFGTSLAIEDAFVICQNLNNLTLDELFHRNVLQVCESFSKIRRKRVNSVYRFQRLLQIFLTDNKFKIWVYDYFGNLMINIYLKPALKRLANYSI